MTTEEEKLLNKVYLELQELKSEVQQIRDNFETAFVRDDYGKPDFVGHRIYHKDVIVSKDRMTVEKSKYFREILTWITIGIISILGTSFVTTVAPTAIKSLLTP